MRNETAPHDVNEVFDLPIDELIVDVSKRICGAPRPEAVFNMARSLGVVGQLQNVLVVWRGNAYELVVGYARALAIRDYGEKIELHTIKAMRISPEDVDLARLIEGFVRRAPGTFELAAQLAGFAASGTPVPHLAVYSAKSEEYVRGLLRLYRELPANVKAAWAADRDHRFTFTRLNDLVRLKQAGDEAGLNARLQDIIGVDSRCSGAASELSYKTADQSLAAAVKACGLTPQANGTATWAPRASTDERDERRRARRMSRQQLEKMAARLGSISPDQLTRFAVGGDMFYRFVCALIGQAPRSEAWSIVDRLVFNAEGATDDVSSDEDLGVVEYPQQPDLVGVTMGDDDEMESGEASHEEDIHDAVLGALDDDDAEPSNLDRDVVEDPQQPDFASSLIDSFSNELGALDEDPDASHWDVSDGSARGSREGRPGSSIHNNAISDEAATRRPSICPPGTTGLTGGVAALRPAPGRKADPQPLRASRAHPSPSRAPPSARTSRRFPERP